MSSEESSSADEVQPIRMSLSGPISDLDLMDRSLLFAELSRVAYFDLQTATRLIEPLGLHVQVEFFDRDGAQAYRFDSQTDVVIACRGTEPQETNDLKADIDAAKVVAETVGPCASRLQERSRRTLADDREVTQGQPDQKGLVLRSFAGRCDGDYLCRAVFCI